MRWVRQLLLIVVFSIPLGALAQEGYFQVPVGNDGHYMTGNALRCCSNNNYAIRVIDFYNLCDSGGNCDALNMTQVFQRTADGMHISVSGDDDSFFSLTYSPITGWFFNFSEDWYDYAITFSWGVAWAAMENVVQDNTSPFCWE